MSGITELYRDHQRIQTEYYAAIAAGLEDREVYAILDRAEPIERAIIATRATSLDEAITKAKVAVWCRGGDIDELPGEAAAEAATFSVLRDLIAMEAGTRMASPAPPVCLREFVRRVVRSAGALLRWPALSIG